MTFFKDLQIRCVLLCCTSISAAISVAKFLQVSHCMFTILMVQLGQLQNRSKD